MKRVVVTGGTRGIGRGLVDNFLLRGCQVVFSGRNEDSVRDATEQMRRIYGDDRVLGLVCEIGNIESLQSLWDKSVEFLGAIDIWVNNAGISIPKRNLIESRPGDIQDVIKTNVTGVLFACQVALRGMSAQGHGQIWNMEGFGSGNQIRAGMTSYGASKRAVSYLTASLQKEVEGSGVQICTLSPGIVVTDLLVGDYDTKSEEWEKSRRIFNILGDHVETVTPFLVNGILKSKKNGDRVIWLTGYKAFLRFLAAMFRKRNLFQHLELG